MCSAHEAQFKLHVSVRRFSSAPSVSMQQATTPPVQNVWSSGVFDCGKEEESCWWSTWCCCIVEGRTIQAFAVGNSDEHIKHFVLLIAAVIFITIIGFLPIALVVLVIGLLYFDYRRGTLRSLIREKLNIAGSLGSDIHIHACCACCSISQEAREAVATNQPLLDYCSGQPLSQLGGFTTDDETIANTAAIQVSTLSSLYSSLSLTSQRLLKLWIGFAVVTVLLMLLSRPLSVLVLLLIFLQPALIMYFFYWRTRRAYASLDLVIKLFTVGFFMATTQSIFFEIVIDAVLNIALAITIAVIVAVTSPSDGDEQSSAGYRLASMLDGLKQLPLARMATPIGLWQSLALTESDSSGDSEEDQQALRRRFFPLIVLYCLASAFVVAAGVEETMKHFAVRCCRMTSSGPAGVPRTASPHTVLVFLLVAALGFATAENMEYVFGVHASGGQYGMLIGELVVLALRLLMPIHLICAVLQSANLSKVVMGVAHIPLVGILLPAVLVHGTFDFVLFLLGAIQATYPANGVAIAVCSFLFPTVITVGSLLYAIRSYKDVERIYDSNWRPVQSDEEHGPPPEPRGLQMQGTHNAESPLHTTPLHASLEQPILPAAHVIRFPPHGSVETSSNSNQL